jgi:hypothetical protein
LLLVGFVALAMRFGLEAILGAFLAGALVSAGLAELLSVMIFPGTRGVAAAQAGGAAASGPHADAF